ncbi:MAG: class I tRNA ligase family protein, partial [Burkholderiaceae bacterium]|nr:class I tRNA ligase family protein [Burkholderiaceae bacterium]
SINEEILKRVVEIYRRVRNTLKFLLANTADFEFTKDAIALEQMLEIDRYALALTAQADAQIRKHYEEYEFHPIVSRLQIFCSEDLGAFYLDILKDRLYTTKADSAARRSAQTALWHITRWLLTTMAPILSFTAEEAWSFFAPGQLTIFENITHSVPTPPDSATLLKKWTLLREWKVGLTKAIEELRTAGSVGSSLQAEVQIWAQGELLAALQSLGEDLRFLTITSQATVQAGPEKIEVTASPHQKCERCWHYRAEVGHNSAHPGICGRCTSNLFGTGEERKIA